jgi:hypothetical protein
MESNKVLMAWKSPTGLGAIQRGEEVKLARQLTSIDIAEKRVAKIEGQLLQASKVEGIAKGLVQQLEKRYNAALNAYDTTLKAFGEEESGYPKYTGEGKFELEGMERKPSIWKRMGQFFGGLGGGEGQVPGPPEAGGFESPEAVARLWNRGS